MSDPRECICDDGTPTWCDRHGDIWYDDAGNAHFGAVLPEVAAARIGAGSELGGIYPLHWEFPNLGMTITFVRDDGAIVTRGWNSDEIRMPAGAAGEPEGVEAR